MRFPLKLLRVLPREPQATAANQQQALLQTEPGSFDDRLQRVKRSIGLPLPYDAGDGLRLHTSDQIKPEHNRSRLGFHTSLPPPAVQARRLNTPPHHPRFMHVKLGAVKPAEIIDARCHVFQWPVRFQVEALIAFDGIRGGVSLRKGVPCEAFDLAPHLFHQHGIASPGPSFLVKGVSCLCELFARPELPTHAASEHIRFSKVESGEMVRDFDDVLLVHHDPVRFWHQFEEHRMGVGASLGVAVPFDVGPHHAAAGNAGPDHRTRRDQSEVVVHAQFPHQHPHGGRLDVKTPDGQRLAE